MDQAAFQTTTAKPAGSIHPVSQAALSGSGKGVLALGGGLSFFDLMFARLASSPLEATAGGASGEQTALQSRNPALSTLAGMKVTELADGTLGITLADGTTDISGLQFSLSDGSNLLDNVGDKKKFLEFLNGLLAGLPDGEKGVIGLDGKLIKKDLMNSAAAGFPGLVAAGLTLDQLTAAMRQFGKDILKDYEGDDSIQGVMVGLIQLMPPKSGSPFDAIVLPRALFVAKGAAGEMAGQAATSGSPSADGTAPTGPTPFASCLNGLYGPKQTSAPAFTPMSLLTPEGGSGAQHMQGGALVGGNAFGVLAAANGGHPVEAGPHADGNAAGQTAANGDVLDGLFLPFGGDLLTSGNWSDPVLDQLGLQPVGQHITSPGLATQLVTQAPQAGSPHPAVQVIAAVMQKVGSTEEARSLTLQLDPPSLGRVEVKMEFGAKDKTVKAHMLVEKQETYLMLQRDSQALERALQNAGLDVNGDALHFELAQDGHDFGQNGGHDGQGAGSGNGGEAGETPAIIETTMTWYVDPETGMQRYDLLV